MQVQVVTYYVANKWGSMQERERIFPASLPASVVQQRMGVFLKQLSQRGQAVYPQFDCAKEFR